MQQRRPAERWRIGTRHFRASNRSSTRPTSGEMERCRAQAEANFVYRLQTVGGFGGKSDQLNAYNVFVEGFFDRDLDRYRRVTAASVQRVARDWLRPERRAVLSVVPKGRSALALAGSRPVSVS
jgi:zinc protease